MAKTFDNISEASATNYLFLFAQRTLALQNEPPTPPPLNALGLPCKGVYLLWKWVQKQKQKSSVKPEASYVPEADATDGKIADTCGEGDGTGTEVAKQKKATDEPHSSAVKYGQGEEKEKTFAQWAAPLAKKITEYINDHQDDAAQEDRWRTTMKRETMKRFREQREAIDKLETAMLTRIDEKMDQLMKSITR